MNGDKEEQPSISRRSRGPWVVCSVTLLGLLGMAILWGAVQWRRWYPLAREVCELVYIVGRDRGRYQSVARREHILPLVAHAGGGIHSLAYTNSLEALNRSVEQGFRYIEVDFIWTSCGDLVALHDWEGTVARLFTVSQRRYSLQEFRSLHMISGLSQITAADLNEWLTAHPDIRIISDVKEDNITALTFIQNRYPRLAAQLVPQIYFFREYATVRQLGYEAIILTLYRANYSAASVLRFIARYSVCAVTMPTERGVTELPRKLRDRGVTSFCHTVNDINVMAELSDNAVYGVYTDFIGPGELRFH